MMFFLLLAQFAVYRALCALTPRQLFWYIVLAYSVVIAVATVPGVLPDGVDVLISRIQNGVSVAIVGYIARTPFPTQATATPQTRQEDPKTPGS